MCVCVCVVYFVLNTLQVAQALAVVLGAAAPTLQTAVFLAPMTAIPMMLFSGFLIYLRNIPPFLRWLQWLSYFHYSFEGCAVAIFQGSDNPQYIAFIQALGFTDDQTSLYGFDIGMLLLFFVVFKVMAYMILRKKAKRTY